MSFLRTVLYRMTDEADSAEGVLEAGFLYNKGLSLIASIALLRFALDIDVANSC